MGVKTSHKIKTRQRLSIFENVLKSPTQVLHDQWKNVRRRKKSKADGREEKNERNASEFVSQRVNADS